ncbi:MAG: exosome complex protein Rrp42 [Candidatus Pacearchaeota archaeon]|nr:exosome complex protein Rrp42 [Candidatus Pacearchaeota archaeon]
MEILNITKDKIRELLEKGRRIDARTLYEFRDIVIEENVSSKAEGSARVRIGDTEVIAGTKLELVEPFADTPDEGILVVNAELHPLASEKFELGPPDVEAIKLARIVDRAIRESNFIDLKKLCIERGKLAWGIFLDIYAINDDGNLIDASAFAAVIALKNTKIPEVENGKVKFGVLSQKKLPLNEPPITITAYKIADSFILDPCSEEQEASTLKITVSITYGKEPAIHGLIKDGEEPIETEKLFEILEILIREGKKIHSKIK